MVVRGRDEMMVAGESEGINRGMAGLRIVELNGIRDQGRSDDQPPWAQRLRAVDNALPEEVGLGECFGSKLK